MSTGQAPGTMTAGVGAAATAVTRRKWWRRSEVEVLGPKREPGYAGWRRVGEGGKREVGGKTRRWRKRLEEVARPRVAPAR